ncbi:SAGA-associated factor 29 homolog A-like isoform X1 [Macadamia integrifolia]|uniref:SAGA-associated factor 29 homolog A-like isoform X1 n=1 Tax=Macadamia integrifolia TaxID=60698 RepID=UPI001C4F4E82|nr:SAGA-associated factor 29 homolog A-like isoform X1 [Macadamia integrifolia]
MSNKVDNSNVLELSKEHDKLRKELDDCLIKINKLHKKLQSSPEVVEKSGDDLLGKLRELYHKAKELTENEVNVLMTLNNEVDSFLLQSVHCRKDGSEQKKKRMKADFDISRLSPAGSMGNQLELAASLKDEQVAARITPDGAEEDEWIVVKVIHFDREAKEFEVLDEEPGDDGEGGGQRKYKLHMSHIISFPKQNDPSSALDFPTGRHVLAVYPGTTALYKATVVNNHRKKKTDDYSLEFDDDEEDGYLPQRTVPFHKVVPLPEGHRQ